MQSMVKVVGLRNFFDEKKDKWCSTTAFFDKPYNFVNHQSLFNSVESLLASIPKSEHYNLHYTLNHVPEGADSKKRMSGYSILPIDIDMIDPTMKEAYIQAVERVTGYDRTHFAVVDSGFGLHFLFELKTPLNTEEELNSIKFSYYAMCDMILGELQNSGLVVEIDVPHKDKPQTTHIDKQVLRVGTLRLPGTMNVKFKDNTILAERECKFITRTMIAKTLAELGLKKEEGNNSDYTLKSSDEDYWGKTDSVYVMEQCGALKEFKEKKGNVSYAQWFNALSVISRFNDVDGFAMAHELSSGHPNYDKDETQKLMETSLAASGPHKCTTFKNNFSACETCTLKCSSPIQLKGKKHLAYEKTGFHRPTPRGSWVPLYKELLLHVGQNENYRVIGDRAVMRWAEGFKKWEKWPMMKIKSHVTRLMATKPGDVAPSKTVSESLALMLNRNIDEFLLEKSKGKVNFQNGWGQAIGEDFVFTPHGVNSFKHGFTYCLPYDYDVNATAPLFEEFLSDIMLGREGLIQTLKEFIGYTLSNDEYWAEKCLVLKGVGANGKSVLLKVIKSLVGEGNYSIVNMKNISNAEARSALVGKIANLSDESPKDSLNDSEDFKLLTSGGEFEYRVLYEGRNQAVNRAKFIFSTNHDLSITDKSSAVGRRLIVVPFDANFNPLKGVLTKKVDPHIANKLLEECSGIFNICMKAYLEAKKRGEIHMPKEALEMIDEMELAGNPVKAYVEHHIRKDVYSASGSLTLGARYPAYTPEAREGEFREVEASALYEDFMAFCEDAGFRGKLTKLNFFRLFKTEMSYYLTHQQAHDTLGKKRRVGGRSTSTYVLDWDPFNSMDF